MGAEGIEPPIRADYMIYSHAPAIRALLPIAEDEGTDPLPFYRYHSFQDCLRSMRGILHIVRKIGYDPIPLVFQTNASTKLASFAN